MADVAANLRRVQDEIAAAATRAGRDPAEVMLLAVSKTRTADEVAAAVRAGAIHLGENYVQELVDKHAALAAAGLDVQWHFIGHLQRNKVRFLAPWCALIESVDSVRLAEEIDRRARDAGRVQPVLAQVDLAGEATKFGCPEEHLEELAAALAALPGVAWQGLMTIPPAAADPEQVRPYYRRLKQWRDRLAAQWPGQDLRHLSMGMSHDYAVAVEEGATIVRIGTAIFGPRA